MSIEQVKAQRAFIEAGDIEQEAAKRIAEHKAGIEHWTAILRSAKTSGALALATIIETSCDEL